MSLFTFYLSRNPLLDTRKQAYNDWALKSGQTCRAVWNRVAIYKLLLQCQAMLCKHGAVLHKLVVRYQ